MPQNKIERLVKPQNEKIKTKNECRYRCLPAPNRLIELYLSKWERKIIKPTIQTTVNVIFGYFKSEEKIYGLYSQYSQVEQKMMMRRDWRRKDWEEV